MSTIADAPEILGAALLDRLPEIVRRPAYDRARLEVGMAHIGVGAFHRCHQAEYTDDLLARSLDRWGVVGINIREPRLEPTLGRQDGLYTRLIRQDDRVEARVIGSIVRTVDSQASAAPAIEVLASPEIDVVTLTVTEKGYCHRPATGELDTERPEIVHDLAAADAPQSLPGLILRALEQRMETHGQPLTVVSCDNIPENGIVLERVVRAMAERRGGRVASWIETHAAFPGTMVDRIAPATQAADLALVEQRFGYRDRAVVVGEPFRQWVIENRFAGRFPRWDLAGASFVDNVTPFEQLKMRVLNGAQTSLCYLGVLAGHEHTFDDMADPLLAAFVKRMLIEQTLPTLMPVPGQAPLRYIDESLARLTNTAIRHRNHQIATDGSQKIVQRLLNPIHERLRRGKRVSLLAVPVAAWMAYLVLASERFGRRWTAEDPYAGRIAGMADRIGADPAALVAEILSIDAIFDPELAQSDVLRAQLVPNLEAFLSGDPLRLVRQIVAVPQGE